MSKTSYIVIGFWFFLAIYFFSKIDGSKKQADTNNNKIEHNDFRINSNIDSTLKSQLREYLEAFNLGNSKIAIDYLHEDLFVYMLQKFPNDYQSIIDVKKNMGTIIEGVKFENAKHKLKYVFEIGEITNKVNNGSKKFYTVSTKVRSIRGLDEISIGGEIICISNDLGNNWKFLQKDTINTSSILLLRHEKNLVEKIMR